MGCLLVQNPRLSVFIGLLRGMAGAACVTGATGTALCSLQRPAVASLLLMLFSFGHGLVLGDFNVLGAHLGKDSRGFGSVLALGTDLVAILVEESREGHAGQRQKGGDGTCPVNTQVLVHVGREQRERGTEEGSKDRVGSQCGGGKDDI